MPTRLPVLLQRRKSAAAGVAKATAKSAQTAKKAGERDAPASMMCLIAPARIIRSRISRRFHLAVNEDGTEVIDVGEGWTGAEKIAQALEEAGGVVVGKKHGRIEAELLCPRGGVSIHICTGGIVSRAPAAVRPIGVASERRDPARACERDGKRERVLLIGTAAAFAADRHG